MRVINLDKDPAHKIKKVKNKKLFSTVIPNKYISIKKPKLLKTGNKSKTSSNKSSFEEPYFHHMKLQAAYKVKPKMFKKSNLASSKRKKMFSMINYPTKDNCKDKKSHRKTDFKSSTHFKTKSTLCSYKTLKSRGKYC